MMEDRIGFPSTSAARQPPPSGRLGTGIGCGGEEEGGGELLFGRGDVLRVVVK